MKLPIATQIRKTALCIATALVIAAPGTASAWGERAQARIQMVRTNAGIQITNMRENNPVRNTIETAKGPATEVFETIKGLQVLEQLTQTVNLVKQMEADYRYFSGGEGCGATCASFRGSLKNVLNNFLSLIREVPALSSQTDLVDNIQRMSNLIDYLPSRALYMMWQVMAGKLTELETAANEIRQTLASLPPLLPPAGFGPSTLRNAGDAICAWSDKTDKPFIDLIQARLEMTGWQLEKIADIIPDLLVEGEGGVSAGAAVANGTASATVGAKPTDTVKIALKLMAMVPQQINWAIKLNRLRAKAVCEYA